MRWYKYLIVLAIGLFLELVIAVISCILIKENGEWLASLSLPYFASRSPIFYGALMAVIYLSSALALAFYATHSADLPKGILLLSAEGVAEIVTLLFFFEFTYEITSFFLATATMILCVYTTSVFLRKSDSAGIARLPTVTIHLYLWTVLYCILMINFA